MRGLRARTGRATHGRLVRTGGAFVCAYRLPPRHFVEQDCWRSSHASSPGWTGRPAWQRHRMRILVFRFQDSRTSSLQRDRGSSERKRHWLCAALYFSVCFKTAHVGPQPPACRSLPTYHPMTCFACPFASPAHPALAPRPRPRARPRVATSFYDKQPSIHRCLHRCPVLWSVTLAGLAGRGRAGGGCSRRGPTR